MAKYHIKFRGMRTLCRCFFGFVVDVAALSVSAIYEPDCPPSIPEPGEVTRLRHVMPQPNRSKHLTILQSYAYMDGLF
jgi:hypothetical protein